MDSRWKPVSKGKQGPRSRETAVCNKVRHQSPGPPRQQLNSAKIMLKSDLLELKSYDFL
jgi:hypothetical protein